MANHIFINIYCLLVLTIALLFTGCSSSGSQAVTNESWTLVELLSQGQKIEKTTKTIDVRYCGIPDQKTIDCSAGTSNSFGFELGADVNLGAVSIGANVSNNIGFDRSGGESLALETPSEGSIYRYRIIEEFRIVSGEVLAISSSGTERTGSYTFLATCSLLTESREELQCINAQEPETRVELPSTSTPIQTNTATPQPITSTPIPIDTPAPKISSAFITIPITEYANASTQEGYASTPLGQVELAGILFDLPPSQNSITTQAEPLPDFPTNLYIKTNVSSPEQVYLLLTGGNIFSRFNGQQIGEVRLHFSKAQAISIPLIAGQNIREWKILDEQTVSRTNNLQVKEVWRAESTHGGIGIMDLLSIDLSNDYLSDSLVGIEIVDSSKDTIDRLCELGEEGLNVE